MENKEIKWQAPGNGKIFDAKLGNNSYMNNRTICVLKYIQKNPSILQKDFEKNIKNYLVSCTGNYQINKSTPSHFFRPLLFMGFITQYDNTALELTIEGEHFLNAYEKNDFILCKKYILNQLDNVKYPNKATKKVNLHIFPFRILFKILLDNKHHGVTSNFIKEQLVYITIIDDISLYIKNKDIEQIKKYKPYNKFYTWVINSLVDIEILQKDSNRYFIHNDLTEYITTLYSNLDYKDFFFDKDLSYCEINNKIAKQRYKRNAKLINKAKNRDKFICQMDNKHTTFISNGVNYVEGHHIIPMFQQKNYQFNLDNINNIISLCPNCHREIHSADNKNTIINKIYHSNKTYMESNHISIHDLYKIYMCAI